LLKLLKYNSTDALSKSDLTDDEKYSLIDQIDVDDTRIFMSPFNNTIVEEERSELRLFLGEISPDNKFLAQTVFVFQILVYNTLWPLQDTKQRPIRILQEVLKSLNGQYLQGVGQLYFTSMNNARHVMFTKDFSGYVLTLQNWST